VNKSSDLPVMVDTFYMYERFGSNYGGWNVVTANIDVNSIVYSFGVGEDISFDKAMIERFGLTIHAFDPTPRAIEYVKSHIFSTCFVMHEYGISSFDGRAPFYAPRSSIAVSYTLLFRLPQDAKPLLVPIKRLSTIIKELGHERIDILKMDIEGAEYDVIEDMFISEIRPRQILVEFHHRFPGISKAKTAKAIELIRSMGYSLFSVPPTKDNEFCFIHNLEQLNGGNR